MCANGIGTYCYPKPCQNQLHVMLYEAFGNIGEINIYTQSGELITKQETVFINGKQNINTQELKSGIYLLEIISLQNKSISKFVKQ